MRNLSNPSKWLNKVLNCLSHQIRVKCAFYSLRKCENQMHLYKRRGKNFNSSSIFIYYFTNLFWRSITLLCTRFFTRCIYDTSHFWFLVTFFWRRSYENTKILHNLCLHFARQDGQDQNTKN